MVAKKKVSKKKVAKKKAIRKTSASTAMVSMADFEKQMAAQAETDSARVGTGSDGAFMSIKGGKFTFQEADLGNELEVVILGFVHEKAYYDGNYDPDVLTAPACFAVADNMDDLAPYKGVAKEQASACAECWADEFGTAATGRGKACRDFRKIMFISTEDLDAEPANIQIALQRVPPTSIKNFDKFIKGIGKVNKRPSYGVITNMTVGIEGEYPVMHFEADSNISDAGVMAKVMQLKEMYDELLHETYDPEGYVEEAPRAKKRVSKKKVAKKKAAKKSRFSR